MNQPALPAGAPVAVEVQALEDVPDVLELRGVQLRGAEQERHLRKGGRSGRRSEGVPRWLVGWVL